MATEITYFGFGEIKTKAAQQLVFFGEKIHLDNRVTVPYAILRAVDIDSGELLDDISDRIAGVSLSPSNQLWHLRCLHLYPALMALRTIASHFRGGNKPRHYLASFSFAQKHGLIVYGQQELCEHMMKSWRCTSALYTEVLGLIPENQMADFIEAGWRTVKLTPSAVPDLDSDSVEMLQFFGLLPNHPPQGDLFD